MYCPICGDEYREGITRCPEHDVELVEDRPEIEQPLSWVDRFNDRTAVRITFLVFLAAAATYAVTGMSGALLYLLTVFRDWEPTTARDLMHGIQLAAFPVAIAALGVLIGALALRTYLILDNGPAAIDVRPVEEETVNKGLIPPTLMRILFYLTILFALVWAGTGIASSREEAEYELNPAGVFEGGEEPSDSLITLSAINYAAYSGGVACLAIMGAGLIVRTYKRSPPERTT
jgi:hypothetical protein